MRSQKIKDLSLTPNIPERVINLRTILDSLTGDPFKKAYESKRKSLNNNGSNFCDKDH